jgi:hypothetical protein
LQSDRNLCILLFISLTGDQYLFPTDSSFQKCLVHERATPDTSIHPLLVALSIQIEANVHAKIASVHFHWIVHVGFAVKHLGSTHVSLLRGDQ